MKRFYFAVSIVLCFIGIMYMCRNMKVNHEAQINGDLERENMEPDDAEIIYEELENKKSTDEKIVYEEIKVNPNGYQVNGYHSGNNI